MPERYSRGSVREGGNRGAGDETAAAGFRVLGCAEPRNDDISDAPRRMLDHRRASFEGSLCKPPQDDGDFDAIDNPPKVLMS
jgi:hypothetical protein